MTNEIRADLGPAVVCVGGASEGIDIYGPFMTAGEADNWAHTNGTTDLTGPEAPPWRVRLLEQDDDILAPEHADRRALESIYTLLVSMKDQEVAVKTVRALIKRMCPACRRTKPGEMAPDHFGSARCESGSLASGGRNAHCTCGPCWG